MELITGSKRLATSTTPTTTSAVELYSMVLPTGSSPWNSCSAVLLSMMATGRYSLKSAGTNIRPRSTTYWQVSK